MDKIRLLIPAAAALSCLARPAVGAEPDYSGVFAGRDGCFLLYDLTANKMLARSSPRRCARRTSPCSTFKVPLALMAFDAGLLKNAESAMKWDGKKTGRGAWDRDQTAATWIARSVVWFSQRLARQLGMKRMKAYLSRFALGNQDLSGGLTRAWLGSTLKVSPDEELRFWRRFWRGKLPVSRHAVEMTKKVTHIGTSPSGWTLHGKTGSGRIGKRPGLSVGWFVGHAARGAQEYVFVASYSDRRETRDPRPGGFVARDIAVKLLNRFNVLKDFRFQKRE